jgi:hypothetical protein
MSAPRKMTWTGDYPCLSCRVLCLAECECGCHENDTAGNSAAVLANAKSNARLN